MFCKHCQAEIPEDAKICPFCGKPVEFETQSAQAEPVVAAEQPQPDAAEVPQKPTRKPKEPVDRSQRPFPLELLSLVVAGIAFFVGLVLGSLILAQNTVSAVALLGSFAVLPSFAALCSAIFTLNNKNDAKLRIFAIVTLSLASFTLFFMFIVGCCVL